MKRLKTLLTVFILIALPLAIVGCGLVGTDRASSDINGSLENNLPEWLALAHRAEAVPQPVRETENDESIQDPVTNPVIGQPASPQPSPTQPAQQPAPQPSSTPRWQQPGTMEYIAKLRLDQLAFTYRNLNRGITDYDEDDPYQGKELIVLKKERTALHELMSDVAASIGLNLDQEYGIKPPPAETSTTPDTTWFYDPDHSPTGFGN